MADRPPYDPWGFGRNGGALTYPPNMAGPNGGPPVPNLFTMSLPLPEIEPIPDAKQFNIEGDVGTVAAGPVTDIPGTLFSVPDNNLAVIRGVNIYVTNMLITTDIRFSLLINGAAPPGFGNLKIFPRVAPFVGNGFDALWRFNGAADVKVVFQNLDGGTYVVGASFSGWYWPEASDGRWKQYGR